MSTTSIKRDLTSIINTLVDQKVVSGMGAKELALLSNMLGRMDERNGAIVSEIADRINALTVDASIKDLLFLALGADFTTTDRSFYINTVADLPDISDPDISDLYRGSVFFIRENASFVFCGNQRWVGFDGRVLVSYFIAGQAYAWGSGSRLGHGTTISQSAPVSVAGNINTWQSINTFSNHMLARTRDGIGWAWGSNNSGRLGDGTTQNRSSPVSIVGVADWRALIPTTNGSFGIREEDGSLWGWGRNMGGYIGDGTTIAKSSPVSVLGPLTDVVSVSSSYGTASAVLADGSLWGWGYNQYNTLGNGDPPGGSFLSPISIPFFSDWAEVASGGCHVIARRGDGTLWSWGSQDAPIWMGTTGSLGDGTVLSRSSPVSVLGGFTDWKQITANSGVSGGLRENGTLWAWGWNNYNGIGYGVLGDGTTEARSSPVSVIGGFTDWADCSFGFSGALAIREDGTLWGWGYNSNGEVGDGTFDYRSSPVSVVGGFTDWTDCAAGWSMAAIREFPA